MIPRRETAGSTGTENAGREAGHDAGQRPRTSVPRTGAGRSQTGETPPPRDEAPGSSARRPGGTGGSDGPRLHERGSPWFRPSPVNAKLIYAGFLASLAVPLLALVAALFAYKSGQQNPPDWLATHYEFQMRTFWIGLAANVVAWALAFVGIGLLLFPLIAVWVVARAVKGLIRVAHGAPIEDPKSYFV